MIDWNITARGLGYPDEAGMWEDLYVRKRCSIAKLSRDLDVSRNTIRLSIEKAGLSLRRRGGPNNRPPDLTDELVEEIKKEGIAAVAKRLHMPYATLYKRFRRRVREAAA
jgi:hypothetical protein